MNPKYLPTTIDGKIDRLVEESGEVTEVIGRVLRIVGKTGRFGLTSAHPEGGPNNAALLLSELADLRHAISVVENGITEHARIIVQQTSCKKVELVWTNELIPTNELRDLIGADCSDDEFSSIHQHIGTCAGQWHREGLEWRFYKDSEWQ
ncbi:hypothetical protein J4G48_0040795 [Bradyrhizobium barranii subsp. apii]|uniref:hypothetical protein n=1 Tax=Bradyrhizobium barranii TaxID=2992140 RepID=UPI001AA1AD5B|nr:hypothetical protein [Bradyrhizobium barranii]UPT95496.1 hypothetical protein J4G48_0040795 [Bradyrhizobium barranii subsp. apii]